MNGCRLDIRYVGIPWLVAVIAVNLSLVFILSWFYDSGRWEPSVGYSCMNIPRMGLIMVKVLVWLLCGDCSGRFKDSELCYSGSGKVGFALGGLAEGFMD